MRANGCANCGHDVNLHDGTGPCPLDSCASFRDPIALPAITINDDGSATVTVDIDGLFALRNSLSWNVDLDTVRYDNGEPDRADLIAAFIAAVDRSADPHAAY